MLKPPRAFQGQTGSDSLDALAYEAAQETAVALGRIGKRLEIALEALSRHDANPVPIATAMILFKKLLMQHGHSLSSATIWAFAPIIT